MINFGCDEFEIPYTSEQLNDFHITCPENTDTLKTLICKRCGGKRFIVGVGFFYAGVKCEKCNWECGIT